MIGDLDKVSDRSSLSSTTISSESQFNDRPVETGEGAIDRIETLSQAVQVPTELSTRIAGTELLEERQIAIKINAKNRNELINVYKMAIYKMKIGENFVSCRECSENCVKNKK